MNPSMDEDQGLLSRCISGDRRASESFVQRFSDLVYRSIQQTLILKQVPYTPQDLEDLHNTVFLQLFEEKCKKLRQYQGKNGCSVASWVRLIAVRIVLNHLRKRGVDSIAWQGKRIPLDELSELTGEQVEPWRIMEKEQLEHLLQNGITNLPPRDRLFMKLHFEKGLSMEQVADAMHLSIQNGYVLKHRAIERLKLRVNSLMKEHVQL